MGVSGSGKTTVGAAAAAALGARFVDADDYHPPSNRAKLSAGIPLTDDDRLPWLTALAELIAPAAAGSEVVVLACSALKESYRRILFGGGRERLVAFLSGPPELIGERLRTRGGHFMSPGLLGSQLETLEEPEGCLRLDIRKPVTALAADIVRESKARKAAR